MAATLQSSPPNLTPHDISTRLHTFVAVYRLHILIQSTGHIVALFGFHP
jgi:hypothetical protein